MKTNNVISTYRRAMRRMGIKGRTPIKELRKLKSAGADQEVVKCLLPYALHIATQFSKLKYVTSMQFEDIVQAANLGLVLGVRSWNARKVAATTWVRRYITREILRARDHAGLADVSIDDLIAKMGEGEGGYAELVLLDPSKATEDQIEDQQALQRFLKRVHKLPVRQREAITLKYGLRDGVMHTTTEISKCLGITPPSTHKLLKKAKEKVQ